MGVYQDLEAQIRSLQAEIAIQQTQIHMNLLTSALLTQTAVIPPTWVPPYQNFTHQTGATRPRPLNCPNCGAPVGGWKCEYCGTRFD